MSYKNSDFTVLTTDNYTREDDPNLILDELAANFNPKLENEKYKKIINREKAFKFSLDLAKEFIQKDSNSRVLIFSTGVGTESGLTQPNGILDWDEKLKWQEVFSKVA